MASAASRIATGLHLAPPPSWKLVAHDILCGDPLNVLDRLGAAVLLAVDAHDHEAQVGLAATAMTWMLVDWARFTGWRAWVKRFEDGDAKLSTSTDPNPDPDPDLDLARAMGAAACSLLRGDANDILAPSGERLDTLLAMPCAGPQRAMQLYLAAGALLPWRQMSVNPAGAQALHGRLAEIAAGLPMSTQGGLYLRGAWLASWAFYLHYTDRLRLPDALRALDHHIESIEGTEKTSALLLKFRSARLAAEQAAHAQNLDAADAALREMLDVLHPKRPMERVIYNMVAAGNGCARKDAESGLRHLEHMARDLAVADCPPSVASNYQQSAWRLYYALGEYERGADVCEQNAQHAHTQHGATMRGMGALGRALQVHHHGETNRARLREYLHSGLAAMRAAKVFNFLISVPEARAGVSALALREGIEAEFVLAALKLAPVPPPAWADEHWPWAMSVRCFGGFRNVAKFAEGQSASKASSRPLNLLMLIAGHGAQGLTVASASDALWPELDADQAENTLSMTLLRLRRLYAEADLIQRNAGWLHLNPSRVWTDVMGLEAHLDGVPDVEASEAERAKFVTRLFDLYRGDCLLGVDDDWAHARVAHYRGRVMLVAQQVLQRSLQANHYVAAEHTVTRAFERGLDVTRLLNAVHPDQRETAAWTQLQQHAAMLDSR